jgi:hypothetical protein
MTPPVQVTPSFMELLQAHHARFACHVCGKVSAGPYCEENCGPTPASYDWDTPRDLIRCEICHRWSCDTHIKNFGYDVWWVCILCFLDLSARIAEEAGDASTQN